MKMTSSERPPRVVLITAGSLRHRYAARRLAERLNLVGIVSEGKPGMPVTVSADGSGEAAEIAGHFAERDAAEREVFGAEVELPEGVESRLTAAGEVNSEETFEWVRRLAPELIVLYGSSIIGPPLLTAWEGRMINLHLGLSPYYRGSGTNFWPLVNRQPELVGATIHLATPRVDGGAILTQVRPEARISDRAHQLGVRTIIAGLDALAAAAVAVAEGRALACAQDESIGRVFRQRDFDAAAVRRMRHHFETGMMEEYIATLTERQRRYPIIEADRTPPTAV